MNIITDIPEKYFEQVFKEPVCVLREVHWNVYDGHDYTPTKLVLYDDYHGQYYIRVELDPLLTTKGMAHNWYKCIDNEIVGGILNLMEVTV